MNHCCNELVVRHSEQLTRRGFLHQTALGAGAAMFMAFAPKAVLAAGGTDVLLLSCMDYRLLDKLGKFMASRGLTDHYDHVILAGASLGVLNQKNISWGQTFWEHVDVAIKLHHIKKIMVVDHRDCGAYKVFMGDEHAKSSEAEFAVHAGQMRTLRHAINRRFSSLSVELFLMDLSGKVEDVA